MSDQEQQATPKVTPQAKADSTTTQRRKKERQPGKKSWLRRLAWTSFLILAVLGAGLYAGIRYLNSPAAKNLIIAQLEQATGRDVTIDGNITVVPGLKPIVELNGFSMSNAEWAKKDPMVSAEQLRVAMSILPLLQKQIVIHEVMLVEPMVRLAINKQGEPNWQFDLETAEDIASDEPAETDAKAKQTGDIQLDRLSIENGTLRFDNYQNKQQHVLTLKVLDVEENRTLDKTTAKLQGQYQGASLSLDATTASINTLLQQTGDVPLVALVTLGKNTLQADGIVQFQQPDEDGTKAPPAYKGNITAEIVDQAALIKVAPAIDAKQLAAVGRLNLNTTGTLGAERVNLSSLKLATNWLSVNGSVNTTLPANHVTANLNGSLKDLAPIKALLKKDELPVEPGALTFTANLKKQGNTLTIPNLNVDAANADISGKNLKIQLPTNTQAIGVGGDLDFSTDDLGILIKQPGYAGRAVTLKTSLDFKNETVSTKELAATIGQSSVTGNLTAKLAEAAGAIPALTFNLTAPALYADDLMPAKTSAEATAANKLTAAKSKGPLFSKDPIDFSAVRSVKANGNISIEKLYLPGYTSTDGTTNDAKKVYENITLNIDANNGDVKLGGLDVVLPGNTRVRGDARLNAANKTPTLAADILISDLKLGEFLKFWADSTLVSNGPATIRTNITTAGNSPAVMAANLNGESSVVIGEMRLASGYVDLLADDLVQNILPFMRKADGETRVNCFVGRWPIKNGVATTDVTVMDTKRITLTGNGSINLGAETLDVTLLPQPKDASLVSLSAPIKISGALTKPRIRPDVGKVATDVLKAVALGAINPLAAVVPFVSFGDDQDVCAAILTNENGLMSIDDAGLKNAKEQGAKALASGKGPLSQVLGINPIEGVGNAVKGVGGAIQGIIPGIGKKEGGTAATPEQAIEEVTKGVSQEINKAIPKDVTDGVSKALPKDVQENLSKQLPGGLGGALFGGEEKAAENPAE